jgi:hypothetical protein
MNALSVDTLEARVGTTLEAGAAVGCREEATGPIAPSCRKANEPYLGFAVLDGRGGGVRLPWGRSWGCEETEGIRPCVAATSAGLNPSATPTVSKSISSSVGCAMEKDTDVLLSMPSDERRSGAAMTVEAPIKGVVGTAVPRPSCSSGTYLFEPSIEERQVESDSSMSRMGGGVEEGRG